MNELEERNLTISLNKQNHGVARQFATEQDSLEKGEKVYLNTLAVCAVENFLQWLNVETDLTAGDCWHPAIRLFKDIADLVIPNLGKLECRPVLPGETVINLPPEATEDRIGYVAVQFQEQLNEVQLLGFVQAFDPENPLSQIEIANLQPIENLIDYLDRLESALDFVRSDDEVAVRVRERLNTESLSEIIAQLDRICRIYQPERWRDAGGDFLANYAKPEARIALRSSASSLERSESRQSQRELQDLAEELLAKLSEIWGDFSEESETIVDSEPTPIPILSSIPLDAGWINLSDCLQNPEILPDYNFQTLESFLINREERLVFRLATAARSRTARTENNLASITAVKQIQLQESALILAICLQLTADPKMDVLLRLYPAGESAFLPEGMQLIVIDSASGENFSQAAQSANNWIQLEFQGALGERFSVKVALGNSNVTDNFVI